MKAIVPAHLCRPSPPTILTEAFLFLALFFVRAERFPKSPGIYIVLYIHYGVEITLTDKTRGKKSLRSQQINTQQFRIFSPSMDYIYVRSGALSRGNQKEVYKNLSFSELRPTPPLAWRERSGMVSGLHICPIGCIFSRQSNKRCIRIGLFQNLRKSLRGRLEGTSG